MEGAPLSLAYTHARNAAQETKRSNPVAASEEHDLAAAEFAAAAQQTTDKEALRVLQLLEQYHKQLGHILKNSHSKSSSDVESRRGDYTTAVIPSNATEATPAKPSIADATNQPPRLARTARSTARDLSTSIASNLASARGIPAARQKRTIPVSPLVSNEHADGTFSQDAELKQGTAGAAQSSRPSWAPPTDIGTPKPTTPAVDSTASDAPFQQFYSTFEGLISKLSAPLAFAGLPLSQPAAEKPKEDTSKRTSSPQTSKKASTKSLPSSPAVTPDYSQLISQAALRAVRDTNPTNFPYVNPHESFLLVPTSGGTMSYADVTAQTHMNRQLQQQQHHHHHHRNTSNASDDFVDASSQILPSNQPQTGDRRASQVQKYAGKTMEELHLENTVLRKTTNDITKRLQAFESAAQTSSAALAQSIRSLHLSPVTTPQNSRGKTVPVGGGGDLEKEMKIKELEVMLQKSDRRILKRDEEIAKYQKKWQELKAGARARREATGAGTSRKSSTNNVPTSTGPSAKDTGQEETAQGDGP